jgi:hypothetical protein
VPSKKSTSTTPTTDSLLGKFKTLHPIAIAGPKAWHDKLRDANPELMKEIDGIIDAFNAGDPDVIRVTSRKAPLANWLKAQCNIEEKTASVVRYISERANGAA